MEEAAMDIPERHADELAGALRELLTWAAAQRIIAPGGEPFPIIRARKTLERASCAGSGKQVEINGRWYPEPQGRGAVERFRTCEGGCAGTGMGPVPEGVDFDLMARYRVGNSMGQGGLRTFAPEPT
jgi:hypothetical protein